MGNTVELFAGTQSFSKVAKELGHETNGLIILDSNELSMTAYLIWVDSVGMNGDRTKCWECYCSQSKPEANK